MINPAVLRFLDNFTLSFISIFVAVDVIAVLPIFISLTEGMDTAQKRGIVRHSLATASLIAVAFVLIGKSVFLLIGITVSDFKIAGGILLFILSVRFLLLPGADKRSLVSDDIGIFPIGTPLLTGPAVMTMLIVSLDSFGPYVTLVSLLINMAICWLVLVKSDAIVKILGTNGTRALSKVMDIILAAIAVMMIRKGIAEFLIPRL